MSPCEFGNGHSVSIKGEEFPDQLSDCSLLKKDSAPCSWLLVEEAPHYVTFSILVFLLLCPEEILA
jgi:hypothetical protein